MRRLFYKKHAFAKSESKKLIIAHIGNVKNQAVNISAAIFGLVPPFLQRPMPIIAQVFACVVAVGMPKKEQTPRNEEEAVSAALLLKGSSSVISHPTFFIIREPPISVPRVIETAQANVIHTGIVKAEVSAYVLPSKNARPNIYTPMNFCES